MASSGDEVGIICAREWSFDRRMRIGRGQPFRRF
jgi:hypothetical protein